MAKEAPMNQIPDADRVVTTLEDIIRELQDQRLDDDNIVDAITQLSCAGCLRKPQDPASDNPA